MKKVLICLTAIALLAACNTNSGGEPKKNLLAFFDAIGKKDFATAKKLSTADSHAMIDMMEAGMKMAEAFADTGKQVNEEYNTENMIMEEAVIDGDKATVAVAYKKAGEKVTFSLRQEGGEWKVIFNPAGLMEMAGEKMKRGNGMADSMLGEMKNVNIDSMNSMLKTMQKMNPEALKKAMQQGQEAFEKSGIAMDSAAKILQKAAQKQ